jgi:KRAB domain-containing zinc finger protein
VTAVSNILYSILAPTYHDGTKRNTAVETSKEINTLKVNAKTTRINSNISASNYSHKCHLCTNSFQYNTVLVAHLQNVHNIVRPFQCEYCNTSYQTKTGLRLHQTKHHTKSTTKMNLKKHHISESYQLECNICHKTFKTKVTLHLHKKLHSKLGPYKCNVCHKEFKLKVYLTNHKLAHTDLRPCVCKICRRSFKCTDQLTKHEKYYHMDLFKYKCSICNMVFVISSSLTRHNEKVHNLKKKLNSTATVSNLHPFKCPKCYKTFKCEPDVISHCKKHLILHCKKLLIKKYKCTKCSSSYGHRSNLYRHIKKIHNSVITVNKLNNIPLNVTCVLKPLNINQI